MMRSGVLGAVVLLMLAGAVQAEAASFVLDDGSVVEGRLIASTRNTLTVRADVGGIRQIPLSQLAGVRALTPSGRTVAGLVRALDGDRIAIAVGGDQVYWIEGDRAVGSAGANQPSAVAASPPAPPLPASQDRDGAIHRAAAPPARSEASTGSAPADEAEKPAENATVAFPPAAPAQPPATAEDPPKVVVTTTGDAAAEGDGVVTFKVTLSHPSDRPVRLIYSTVDGQAESGTDYEPQQGVLTLPAGETVREIEARLVDDVVAEEAEQFFLFVTADPADASLAEKWHAVTIADDD